MYERVVPIERTLQCLWRYLSEHRLIELLENEELFFCPLSRLSDGLEGALTDRTRARLRQFLVERYGERHADAMVDDYERDREQFYVNCWHINDHESYLMWKVYAERGFAIQSNVERVEAAFAQFPGVVRGQPVQYVDYTRDAFPFGNAFVAIGHKDMPYRDEREFRLLFWPPDKKNKGVPVRAEGVRVRVDVEMLIQSIYRSPVTPPITGRLATLMSRYGLAEAPSSVRIKGPA
jgi:hypothetical protein